MATEQYLPQTTTVGFVGLGIMGEPMAKNLIDAGFTVRAHNRSRPVVERLAEYGAVPAGSPAGAAQGADVVITVLPDSPDVEKVMAGEAGVLEGIAEGALIIDMSTISPVATRALSQTLADRGVRMLDAPVSGGQQGAIDGALTIMVGGEQADFDACRLIFEAMGANITLVGGTGAGQVAKACNQMIVAGTIQIVGEALALAEHAGVDPATVRSALMGGFAGSKILEVHGQRMIDRSFDPGFKVKLHNKDLRIALETAADAGVPVLSTALGKQLFAALEAQGHGDADHSALALLVNQLAGESGPNQT